MPTKQALINHAITYIDKLAKGINPLDNLPINANDVIKKENIIKCFQYVSRWLDEYANLLQKNDIQPPETDSQKQALIHHAKEYIDKLANGNNPIDNTPIDSNDVVKKENIIKCFQHVSRWLDEYANILHREELTATLKGIIKKNIKQHKPKKHSPTIYGPVTNAPPTQSYPKTHNKDVKKSCDNCKLYVSGDCGGGKDTCKDYTLAPILTPDITTNWPTRGDATTIRQGDRPDK